MKWIERLNKAINYIEEHITDNIDYEEVAKVAYCSSYHFQRMFAYMTETTLSEYIRRRRMSLAAVDLKVSNEKIIDIALKYGYSSPTAFNRAFQSIHGIAPSHAKKPDVSLKSFPPISFTITIKGDEVMNYRIEKKEAFNIFGISMPLHKEMDKNFAIVPKMWQDMAANGTLQKLASKISSEPMGILGVCTCNNEQEWRYYIAVSGKDTEDGQYENYQIPSFTWAIFPGEGTNPQAIQELEKRIITEWLPTSGYEYDNGPDIEVYLNDDPNHSKFEVWIPVRKA